MKYELFKLCSSCAIWVLREVVQMQKKKKRKKMTYSRNDTVWYPVSQLLYCSKCKRWIWFIFSNSINNTFNIKCIKSKWNKKNVKFISNIQSIWTIPIIGVMHSIIYHLPTIFWNRVTKNLLISLKPQCLSYSKCWYRYKNYQ